MLRKVIAALAALTFLVGCASQGGENKTDQLTKVTFALDWSPNTNHAGIYAAQQLGYFKEAGLEVEILPYASTPVSDLVAAGKADFGIDFQSEIQLTRSLGVPIKSVYRVTQSEVGELVTMPDRADITSPKDLEGKIFGGFGSPISSSIIKAMISHDGGNPQFKEVSLDTGAYDALANGRVDFTLSIATWETINTRLEGNEYKTFQYADYGVPVTQSVNIISSEKYLDKNAETARAFLKAVQRGYEYSAKDPVDAAKLLIEANSDTLASSEQLVTESMKKLAEDGYFVKAGVRTGAADPKIWAEHGKFLFENKILTDSAGAPLTAEPDWTEYYTDEYLS